MLVHVFCLQKGNSVTALFSKKRNKKKTGGSFYCLKNEGKKFQQRPSYKHLKSCDFSALIVCVERIDFCKPGYWFIKDCFIRNLVSRFILRKYSHCVRRVLQPTAIGEGLPGGGCMFPCSLWKFTVVPLFLKKKLRCSQKLTFTEFPCSQEFRSIFPWSPKSTLLCSHFYI